MSEKIREIFKNISGINPPKELESLILRRVKKIQKRAFWVKTTFSFSGVFASILSSAYVFSVFGKTLLNSEFWSLFSLAFSDATVIMAHWQEFLFSLLETMPSIIFALILIPIFTLLASLNYLSEIYSNYNKFNNYKYYF
jgi:hypothetical protein